MQISIGGKIRVEATTRHEAVLLERIQWGLETRQIKGNLHNDEVFVMTKIYRTIA
jgi:hypothetical protein